MPLFFFPRQRDVSAAAVKSPTRSGAPAPTGPHPSNAESGQSAPHTTSYSPLHLRHIPFYPSTFEVDMPVDLPLTIQTVSQHVHAHRHPRPRVDPAPLSSQELLTNVLLHASLTPFVSRGWPPPPPSPCAALASEKTINSGRASVSSGGPVLTYALPSWSLKQRCSANEVAMPDEDDSACARVWRRDDGSDAGSVVEDVVSMVHVERRWHRMQAHMAWYDETVTAAFLLSVAREAQERADTLRTSGAPFPSLPPFNAREKAAEAEMVRRLLGCGGLPRACTLLSPETALNTAETTALWYLLAGAHSGGGGEWLRAVGTHGADVAFPDFTSSGTAAQLLCATLSVPACTVDMSLLLMGPALGRRLSREPSASPLGHFSLGTDASTNRLTDLAAPSLSALTRPSNVFDTIVAHFQSEPSPAPPSSPSPSTASSQLLEAQRASSTESTTHPQEDSHHEKDDDDEDAIARRLWQVELDTRTADTSITDSLLPFVLLSLPPTPYTTRAHPPTNRHVHNCTDAGLARTELAASCTAEATPRVSMHLCLPDDVPARAASIMTGADPGHDCLAPFAGFGTASLLFVSATCSTTPADTDGHDSAQHVYLPTLRNTMAAVLRHRCARVRRWHRYVLDTPRTQGPAHSGLAERPANGAGPRAGALRKKRARSPSTPPPCRAVSRAPLSCPSPALLDQRATRYRLSLRYLGHTTTSRCAAATATFTHFMQDLLRAEVDPYNPSRSLYAAELQEARFDRLLKTACLLLVDKAKLLPTSFAGLEDAPCAIALSACSTEEGGLLAQVQGPRARLDKWMAQGVRRESTLLFCSYFYDLVDMAASVAGSAHDEEEDAGRANQMGLGKPANERLWMAESDDEDALSEMPDVCDTTLDTHTRAEGWWRPSLVASTRFMGTCQSQPQTAGDTTRHAHAPVPDAAEPQGWAELAGELLAHGPCHPLFRPRYCRAVVPRHALAQITTMKGSGTKRPRASSATDGDVDKDVAPLRGARRLASAPLCEAWLPLSMQTALAHRRAQQGDDALETSDMSDKTSETSTPGPVESAFCRVLREWEEAAATRSLYAHANAERRRPRVLL